MNPRMKKFLSFYKPYLRLLAADLLCASLVSAITLTLPLCVRYITKYVLESGAADITAQIIRVGLVMLALAVVHTLCGYYVGYHGHVMGAMMEKDMRSELFDHFQKLPFSFYDNQRTGQLMSRITNDLLSLTELYHHGPEDIIIYFVRFIGAFFILCAINFKLTMAVFLFIPVMVVYVLFFTRRLGKAMRRSKARIADVNAQVEDTLAGIRVVKSFANEEIEKGKFSVQNNRFFHSRKNIYQNETFCWEGALAFVNLITVVLVVFGGIAITNAQLDLADLITFLLYVGYITEPVQQLVHITNLYQEGFTSFERFMEILETTPEIQDKDGALDLTEVQGSISFQGVGFCYGKSYGDILSNIDLEVRAGEYIALVGSSGVGKSTLCSLIPRFYDVTQGRILVDGVDVRQCTQKSLRRNVGVVQQDVYLFSGTVFENIQYGRPGANREEVVAAAKQANAHQFILELPQGYDTDIGQRGVKLSGGQKQRLSIARVFLKDPAILILDEATSSLDYESEQVVQQSLSNLIRGRTTLVIAHRLSTVQNAQRILVLSDKGIREEGTHQELLEQGGDYAKLYQIQFQV